MRVQYPSRSIQESGSSKRGLNLSGGAIDLGFCLPKFTRKTTLTESRPIIISLRDNTTFQKHKHRAGKGRQLRRLLKEYYNQFAPDTAASVPLRQRTTPAPTEAGGKISEERTPSYIAFPPLIRTGPPVEIEINPSLNPANEEIFQPPIPNDPDNLVIRQIQAEILGLRIPRI